MSDILKEFEEGVRRHTVEGYDEFFSANSFIGEVGELANARKKLKFQGDHPEWSKLHGKDYVENSLDEAGDTLFYLFQWLHKAGISVERAMNYQLNKLERQSLEVGKTFKK